jgi:hypothetical protein
LEKPPSESATQRRKRAKEGDYFAAFEQPGVFTQELGRVLPQGLASTLLATQ